MSLQRVALLCIDPGDERTHTFRPFSYGARRIQAALIADPAGGDVEVRVFECRAERQDEARRVIEAFDPTFVGASAYVWSLPALVELAQQLKATRSDRTIVFGGPSARPEMLSLAPYRGALAVVDALVIGYGEDAIRELVRVARTGGDVGEVPGCAVPRDGRWELTSLPPHRTKLDDLPSPYQLHLVDRGMTAHLETYRGCPFACSFCEWGQLAGGVLSFSEEYMVRELEAIREARPIGITNIDAALNLSPTAFRNLAAAEDRVGLLRTHDFHCELYPSRVTDEQIELLAAARHAGVSIGVQSFDPEVLDRLDRPFDPERFDPVYSRVSQVATTALQIIIGLPGDNPTSFRATFDRANRYECGLQVFHCLVLPDALMTRGRPDFDMVFDPISLKMSSCLGWSEEDIRREWDHVAQVTSDRGGECEPMKIATIPHPDPPRSTRD